MPEELAKGTVILHRSQLSSALCYLCDIADCVPPKQVWMARVEVVKGKVCSLHLCRKHELDLLSLLLNNFVRRVRRHKEQAVLLKEEEKEADLGFESVALAWNPVTQRFEAAEGAGD